MGVVRDARDGRGTMVAPGRFHVAARELWDLIEWIRDKLERLERTAEEGLTRSSLHSLIRACDAATNPRLHAALESVGVSKVPSAAARSWTIRKVPLSLNRTLRMHWSARRREARAWRHQVRSVCGRPRLRTSIRVALEITVHRRRPQDPDNSIASLKPVLDSLVREGWLRDDAWKWLDLKCSEVPEPRRGLERTEIRWTALPQIHEA